MNEIVLEIIMRLFASVAKLKRAEIDLHTRHFVQLYLTNLYSEEISEKYLAIYDEEVSTFTKKRGFKSRKQDSKIAVKILMICDRLNKELSHKQKLQIIIRFLELLKYFELNIESRKSLIVSISDVINSISVNLNISKDEFSNCHEFILNKPDEISNHDNLLIIDNSPENIDVLPSINISKKFTGRLFFLWINSVNSFIFKSTVDIDLFLNGHRAITNQVYLFNVGDTIRSNLLNPIYFNELSRLFTISDKIPRFYFQTRSIEFRYKKTKNGLRKISFNTHSGQLVGIMGASGAGKSTFMSILGGKIKPDAGEIYVNGFDIIENSEDVKGIIGFVPQDDLLIEELTVYENLLYNAQLCIGNVSNDAIIEIVEKLISDLGLSQIKNLKVGSPLNKFISGGERKRLNVAMELVREPSILMIDEPTSGLSSKDSEDVIDLLKQQTLKGTLLFINIHQPSSSIFKLLDYLIIIDKGGFPVYAGNPLNALGYLKTSLKNIGAEENECSKCGNVNPEEIFRLIDTKAVDAYGEFTHERKMLPEHWYYLFRKKFNQKQGRIREGSLPEKKFSLPNKLKQLTVYTYRNVLTKVRNKQFITLSLSISPILAFILSSVAKFIPVSGNTPLKYAFAENINIPALFFMYIIVAMFVGLIVSAEDIYKDTRLWSRDKYIKLSSTSYLLSKYIFLFSLSAIQTFVFVVISNSILEIKGMLWPFWFLIFSVSCFSNVLGLAVSVRFKSIVAIYISIPMLIIPQLLLSGAIIDFDKVNYKYTSYKYVPVLADLMASRWAYEAIIVKQQKDNEFEKIFFENNLEASELFYKSYYLIPEITKQINTASELLDENNGEELHKIVNKVIINLKNLDRSISDKYFTYYKKTGSVVQERMLLAIFNDIKEYRNRLEIKYDENDVERNALYQTMKEKFGNIEKINEFKDQHVNKRLSEIVLKINNEEKIINIKNELIRKFEPLYQAPNNNYGRAHFFAPYRITGNWKIDTFVFNLMVIWVMAFVINWYILYELAKKQ